MKRLTLAVAAMLGAIGSTACRDDGGAPRLLAASQAGSPVEVTASFAMPVRATTTTEVTGCDNSPGPNITIEGALALGGLGTRMTFTNNVKGTHTFSSAANVEVVVVPNGESITIPKQPVLGGVGGNPFIWIKLEDGNGTALTDEIYLGRCVQGLRKNANVDWSSLARAFATIAVADCANSPGPYITLDGDLEVTAGLDAKLIFRNNDNPVGGPHEANADAVVRVQLVPPGHDVRFHKQPVLGGVGGNPWIWFQFLKGDGSDIGERALLGRCEQLSKS
ncbi:MAG TPA: hypothetical protein VGA20_01340 [Gemmatimonadales bacterium]